MRFNLIEAGPVADIEVVERKGTGHPDSLSDGLAEALSVAYSRYTRERFGAVLHHNFDKVGLLGGRSEVDFGRGRMTSPIRVLVNGRTSNRFGDEDIPVEDIIVSATREFLGARLPKIDPEQDLTFLWNLSSGSSPGQVDASSDKESYRRHWFAPRDLSDLRELTHLVCNDTSIGTAYAPLSPLETFVLQVEKELHEEHELPWLGTDIKVLAVRRGTSLDLTMCLPQIADEVPDLEAYAANIETARGIVSDLAARMLPGHTVELFTNTRDKYDIPELYLTATGSSIESGDEGLVGRGNRANGLIATARPYTMEGVCGKNPVYHTGKIYTVAAQRIADELAAAFDTGFRVWVIGQAGRALDDPWEVVVAHEGPVDANLVEVTVKSVLSNITSITDDLLSASIRLY
ncbi:methionine adenosyltransferase [Streptomyces sp. NRRL B-24085]|uniref:methionine adenosyltransferase n=1 Tax=Streptomyces sp. NRRL B-24085 TaxID=1709476 RepID=UPI0006B31CF6|nr:methionine adenosyltransferase [Streptomyces sp. NRRL B-24085]